LSVLRILIADDHEVARKGIRSLLESHPDWEVCAEASDGREAVEYASRLKPDVLLLDIGMPNLNGLDASRQILATNPEARILILTVHDSEQMVREVLALGASGFLLESDAGRSAAPANILHFKCGADDTRGLSASRRERRRFPTTCFDPAGTGSDSARRRRKNHQRSCHSSQSQR